jgi:hypothetical protein
VHIVQDVYASLFAQRSEKNREFGMTALAHLAAGAVQDWTAASEFAACTLEADPRSVRTAREFARSTLRCWERDEQIGDIEVAVSEDRKSVV